MENILLESGETIRKHEKSDIEAGNVSLGKVLMHHLPPDAFPSLEEVIKRNEKMAEKEKNRKV